MRVSGKAISVLLGLVIVYGGYRAARYFFDTSIPEINVIGLEEQGCYAKKIACKLLFEDGYKLGSFVVELDGAPLAEPHAIGRKNFEAPCPLDTTVLADGLHTLKITVKDAAFHVHTAEKEIPFIVDNAALTAAFVRPDKVYKVFQGQTLHVQFQANKLIKEAFITLPSGQYSCMQEGQNAPIYECFAPIGSEEKPSEHLFTITVIDRVGNSAKLEGKIQVVMFPFSEQLLAVGKEKFEKEAALGKPEKQLEEDLLRITKNSPKKKLWTGAFDKPCNLKGVSTAYGTLRTTHERGKYRHNAVDLLAPPKSSVWASQDGVVALIDRYAHSGNTVVIDHGYGVISLYFHLETVAKIAVGDAIKKGQPVGTLGMTGYASGYHLHWELRINNISVDPMQWTLYDF
jgi:murein DD-endopeptidase MepM/ murein hydrolase activator NlpD